MVISNFLKRLTLKLIVCEENDVIFIRKQLFILTFPFLGIIINEINL